MKTSFIRAVITSVIYLQQAARTSQDGVSSSNNTSTSYSTVFMGSSTTTNSPATAMESTTTTSTTSYSTFKYNLSNTSILPSDTIVTNATQQTVAEVAPIKWPTNVDCDFNGYKAPMCDWTNARAAEELDDFDWKHGRGRDAHKKKGGQKTGVKSDSSGSTAGGYMYIKASKRKRLTRLFSPTIYTDAEGCFQFWFHMSGRNTGHLQVGVLPARNHSYEQVIWKLRGSQSVRWQPASIPIPRNGDDGFVITFEASDLSSGRFGNIAIDDITFVRVSHNVVCSKTPFFAFSNLPKPSLITTPAITLKTATSAARNTTVTTPHPVSKTDNKVLRPIMTISTQTTSVINKTTTGRPVSNGTAKLIISLSILGAFVILVLALVGCIRYRRQRRFNYYDNCTVAMTRMSPDIVISNDNNKIEYQKLNQA